MNYKWYQSRNTYWAIAIFIILVVILAQLIGCGADESNVDSQSFVDDFGEYSLRFNINGCNRTISVTQYTSQYFITEHGQLFELQGIDREVIKDVGTEYQTEDFVLTKYVDGRIVSVYKGETCQITVFDAS